MYTGRIFQSNFNWLLLMVRSVRHGCVFEKSSILFKSIVWSNCTYVPSEETVSIFKLPNEYDDEKFMNSQTGVEDWLKRADELFSNDQFRGSYILLLRCPVQTIPEIKWRLARALYSISRAEKDKVERSKLIDDAFILIKSALEDCGKHFAIHKWMSIILDAKVEHEGIKSRIEQINQVHKHIEKAVQLNSKDPTSWHFLGALEYGLAELPWMQKKFVATLSHSALKGSYKRAFEHFQHAEDIRPGFYLKNILMLGKCAFALKRILDARRFLRTVLQCHDMTNEDNFCKQEAVQLLRKIHYIYP